MKKSVSLFVLVLAMIFVLILGGCGKSDQAVAAEELIRGIGDAITMKHCLLAKLLRLIGDGHCMVLRA